MKALMKKMVAGAVVALAATASAKTAVTPPTIESKVYTGSAQTADVTDTTEWTVLANQSRTDVGTSTVILNLNDSGVYEWASVEGVTIDGDVCKIPFVVTKAANAWTTEPARAGWTWGETIPTPVGAAKFGTVSLTYSGTTASGGTVSDATSVTAAGSYTAHFKVAGTSNYDGLEKDVEFTVAVGTISGGGGGGSGSGATLNATDYSGKYDGQPHSATVSVSGAAGEVFEITYSTEEFGTYSLTKPTWTAAGSYTMWYKIKSASYAEFKNSLTVNISKAGVTPPTIDAKPYTGETQKADVPESDLYEVVANFGGKSVGSYMVVLQLADKANYEWTPTAGVTINADDGIAEIPFVITKAANKWTTEPAMDGWTWGETVPTPAGAAKFGEPKLTFSGTTTGGASVSGATSVTAPGNYTALFKVEGTDNYDGLEKSVSVVVEVGQINVDPSSTAEPRLVVTAYEGVYDGAAHSNLVQIVGAGSETFTVGYATSEDGPFVAEAPTFTDACEAATVWYSVTSSNFAPVKGSTTLKIAKRPITLTSGDGTWEADGVAHSNVTVTVGGDGFVDGEGATYSGFPEVTEEGTCENTFTVTFNDGTLAGNYDVTSVYGTLTITAPAVTLYEETDEETIYKWEATGATTAKIVGFKNASQKVTAMVLPDKIAGYFITEIARGAFANSKCGATSVKLPRCCTKIGFRAFSGIKTLASVTFVDVLDYENLGSAATLEIGEYAFAATALTSVTTPSSVSKIGDYAFADCRKLTSVTCAGSPTLGVRPFRRAGVDAGITEDLTVTTSGMQVAGNAVRMTLSVAASVPYGAIDANALTVSYRPTLDATPTTLAPTVVGRAADGSVTVEVTPPEGASSGFFQATLNTED